MMCVMCDVDVIGYDVTKVVGVVGYLTFGDSLSTFSRSSSGSDVLTLYSPDSFLVLLAHISITFVATFTFPLQHFVARFIFVVCSFFVDFALRLSLLDIFTPFYRRLIRTYSIDDPHDTLGTVDDHYLYYGLTFTYYFLCLYFALVIPDIKVVLAFIGGTAVVMMSLILPGQSFPNWIFFN